MNRPAAALTALTAFAALASLAALAAAQYSGPIQGLGASGLVLNITRYYPFPAEPGRYADVWFDILNDGPTPVDNPTCEFLPTGPFTLEAGEPAQQTLRQLQSRQGWLLRYRVRVDANAVEGESELKVRCRSALVDWVEAKTTVSVRSPEAVVNLVALKAEPSVAPLGGRVKVTLRVANEGASLVKDLTARLDLSQAAVPFAAVDSGAEHRVSQLSPEAEEELSFELAVLTDAEPRTYKVPLVLNWSSALGRSFSKTEYIALSVGQKPALSLGIDSTDMVVQGRLGRVVVRVANGGPVPARYVRVTLRPADQYQALTTSEAYVGNIDSDGVETAEFRVQPAPGTSLPLNVQVEFEDANGLRYTESRVLDLTLYPEEEALRRGLIPRPDYTLYYALGGLVVLYLLYRGYRWFSRRRR
jgi:hypothetical protein